MRTFNLIVIFLACFALASRSQERALFTMYGTKLVNDSDNLMLSFHREAYRPLVAVNGYLRKKEAASVIMHTTQKGRSVEAYFFPGKSEKKALVIAGMHGSELSSIEVAKALVRKLSAGKPPYYNVVVVPVLFPDNATEALTAKGNRIADNTGRYTSELAADPNRQMPALGKPYRADHPVDAMQREIEGENASLLDLIQTYQPDRLVSIHAIKDKRRAGVFADPRTDCSGYALGYDSDKALALLMAQSIEAEGGACPGNNLQSGPTTLYYLDPAVADEGSRQERSFDGSKGTGRGIGVSLGSWSSTAVCHDDESLSRPAIRTFTMEFPGYQRPAEYKIETDRQEVKKLVQLYAGAIHNIFLQSFFVEENTKPMAHFISN